MTTQITTDPWRSCTDLGKPALDFLPISRIPLIINLRASKQARSIIHEAHCAMISRRFHKLNFASSEMLLTAMSAYFGLAKLQRWKKGALLS